MIIGAFTSLIGKPVQVRCCPATVTWSITSLRHCIFMREDMYYVEEKSGDLPTIKLFNPTRIGA